MESGSSCISGNRTDYSTDTTEVLSNSLMEYTGDSSIAESDAGDGEVSSEYNTDRSTSVSVNPNEETAYTADFSLSGVDPRSPNLAQVINYTNYLTRQHPAINPGYPVPHWVTPVITHAGIFPVTGTLPAVPPVPGISSVVTRLGETGGSLPAGAGTSSAVLNLYLSNIVTESLSSSRPTNDGILPEPESMAKESKQYCKLQQEKKQKGVLMEAYRKPAAQSACSILAQAFSRPQVCLDLSLRDYLTSCSYSQLKQDDERGSKAENLRLFTQVVQMVDAAQGEGIVLTDMRPSRVFVSPSLHLRYTGALVPVESRSLQGNHGKKKLELEDRCRDSRFWATYCCQDDRMRSCEDPGFDQLEKMWYGCVDQRCGDGLGACNAHSLGVLWFELLFQSESPEKYSAALADLGRLVLPEHVHDKEPKAAAFCLHLLNPATRPSTREILDILQSF